MKEETKLEEARALAERFHGKDVDKSGHPYMGHLDRVSARGKTTDEKIAGMLHDLLEDHGGEISEADVRRSFGDTITDALMALNFKKDSETRQDYLRRVSKNKLALAVKWNDLADNSDTERLAKIHDEALRKKLTEKYVRDKKFLAELTGAYAASGHE